MGETKPPEAPRCQTWLPQKRRHCAAAALPNLSYCGNHKPADKEARIPCPIDPSHTILQSELKVHSRKCPALIRLQNLEQMPYFRKNANTGSENDDDTNNDSNVSAVNTEDQAESGHEDCNENDGTRQAEWSSGMKRKLYNSLSRDELEELVRKIESAYDLHCKDKISSTFQEPSACKKWFDSDLDRRIPFQKKHVVQQASMLGNMEMFGILHSAKDSDTEQERGSPNSKYEPVFIEFGAGRGYLAHMLADCYDAHKFVLVERRSYKFKADRTLRQNTDISFERVRIDIEDLDLSGVKSLQGSHYTALSKHLCGSATDLTLRCCIPRSRDNSQSVNGGPLLDGIAIATCCHHLCQWKTYVNKQFFKKMGFTKNDFYIITWLTSGAVSGDKRSSGDDQPSVHHSSETGLLTLSNETCDNKEGKKEHINDFFTSSTDRANLGLKCKQLIDIGRMYWCQQCGLDAKLVTYVPATVTPENKLLLARSSSLSCVG